MSRVERWRKEPARGTAHRVGGRTTPDTVSAVAAITGGREIAAILVHTLHTYTALRPPEDSFADNRRCIAYATGFIFSGRHSRCAPEARRRLGLSGRKYTREINDVIPCGCDRATVLSPNFYNAENWIFHRFVRYCNLDKESNKSISMIIDAGRTRWNALAREGMFLAAAIRKMNGSKMLLLVRSLLPPNAIASTRWGLGDIICRLFSH